MKISLFRIVTAMALAMPLWAAAPEATTAVPEKKEAKDLETLIRELADENFRVREAASRQVWEMGEAALEALEEAAASSDPEQQYRARDLLRKIQLCITSDTDPAIIELVERYEKASSAGKMTLLVELRRKQAWRQMLKLFASETDPDLRQQLRPAINGVSVKAARERLFHGDADGARKYLELAPADSQGLLALAEFHRSHGTLEAELERAKGLEGRKALLWQLALYRAAGDLESARAVASAAGETTVASAMAALLGDPLPWLTDEAAIDGGREDVSRAYAAIAARRWRGEKVPDGALENLTRRLSARSSSERGAALNALFLLGEFEVAQKAYTKLDRLAAFRHFEALEKIPQALAAFDLDPVNPDFAGWMGKRLHDLGAKDVDDEHDITVTTEELVAVANFLERRGLHDELFEAFIEPAMKLADQDINVFVDFLGSLFGAGGSEAAAPMLATRIGLQWAGDDDDRWDDVLVAAFGDSDETSVWWDWFGELKPKATRPERFAGMMAVFRLGTDRGRLREKWFKSIWKGIVEAPDEKKEAWIERVALRCFEAGDVNNSLRAWDTMGKAGRGKIFWGQVIVQLSAVDRWDEAAEMILQQIAATAEARQEASADLHAYAASALRLAGREEEAATHDQWVDKLVLASPAIAIRVGNAYAYGRDYQRAADWWGRAACETDPGSGEFALALKLWADLELERHEWKRVAALSEVISQIYSSSDYRWSNPLPFMRERLQADMAHAISMLESDRSRALAILSKCHDSFASDGSLADFFFPSLRAVGLVEEHDRWFGETWDLMTGLIARYPGAHNTRNTTAWFASRACRQLDEAEELLKVALDNNPDQAAYLDTMAEIQFAKGNRKQALKWSKIAVNFSPEDSQLRRQQERFRSAPLPK